MGGLTVVREMMKQLPNESIIYFGDTARVPYGPKSPDTVLRYSREITAFLKEEGVKALVIACNTATAHALPALRREYDIPIVGVIQPGARAAAAATKTKRVGVIGTAGTIKSRAYEKEIKKLLPDAEVTAQLSRSARVRRDRYARPRLHSLSSDEDSDWERRWPRSQAHRQR
jgi:glutamate racemase